MKKIISLFGIFLLSMLYGDAQSPTQTVKTSAEKILLCLGERKLITEINSTECLQLVRGEMDERFAWNEIARACLGRHWAELSPAQKQEFTNLFSEFLIQRYSNKIISNYSDFERIEFQGESMVDNSFIMIKFLIITKTKPDRNLQIQMVRPASGDEWKISDIAIDNVSIQKLYHYKLNQIIEDSSYEELVKLIKEKLNPGLFAL